MRFDAAFVKKNKRALLEEISIHLHSTRELVANASLNPDALASSFVGIASELGSIDALFRQYLLFKIGEMPPPPTPIGFRSFEEPEECNDEDDDDNEFANDEPQQDKIDKPDKKKKAGK